MKITYLESTGDTKWFLVDGGENREISGDWGVGLAHPQDEELSVCDSCGIPVDSDFENRNEELIYALKAEYDQAELNDVLERDF